MPFPWNMSRRPAATDLRVRLVQTRLGRDKLVARQKNRTKTVYAKAKGPQSAVAKFDAAEAMCQVNRIGHDYSRVQVGEERLT